MLTLMPGYFASNALTTAGPIVRLSVVYQLSEPSPFAPWYSFASRAAGDNLLRLFASALIGLGGGAFSGADVLAPVSASAAAMLMPSVASHARRLEMRCIVPPPF